MRNRRLEGKYVILDELQPKYFEYVIKWRNNPELNRYINQPFVLTMENQTKWYEEKYLKDETQGMMVMVDKETGIPFGTNGWTNYDSEEKVCIHGRAMIGEYEYRATRQMIEGYTLFQDYLYESMNVDVIYIHVVNENKQVISFNKRWGYVINEGDIRYPNELLVNNMQQTEFYRTYNQYKNARAKIINILQKM